MGGNLAQDMSFYHPEKVENLVLIDCTFNTMKLSWVEKFLLSITPGLLRIYPWENMIKQSIKASSINPKVQKYLKETFEKVGYTDFKKIFLETAACLHYEKDYRISKPVLLVCGESDNTGNIKKVMPSWDSYISDGEFHIINDASHCSNQDNSEEFNRLLIDFLRKKYPVVQSINNINK
jgi:pimeloyl-ACP methyl ester carboxylesterase